jgi:HK97 family phage portal protein
MIVSGGAVRGGFAPQALGEIVPNVANGYFYSPGGVGLLGHTQTYGALYKAQPSIATLVDKVANSAARLTLKVWDPTPKAGKVLDTASEYARLIANPCTTMSTYSFYRWTFSTYEIYGEAFWLKQRNSAGQVVNLLPMHPSRTVIQRAENGGVEYVFTLGVASAGLLKAPEEDVVAFLRYHPEQTMRGMSRLEPLRSTLQNEDAARRANASWWLRGARPSVVLTHPAELSQNAMDRIKQQFDARHAGADNMGGSAVLQEGMTAAVIQLNAEEMQYIESRKLNMQEACMVFDVPPPVVHILDHATFSNITEQMRSMYRDTMSPRLEEFESVLDFALRSEFFNTGERQAKFDMDEVLRGDFEVRVTSSTSLRQTGQITGNESRAMIGLPLSTDPEMDKLYANAALVPLGQPVERVTVSEAAPPSPALAADATAAEAVASEAAKSIEVRSLMGALARMKNRTDIKARLVDEHAKALGDLFARQRAAAKAAAGTKAAGVFDPEAWDGDLSSILHTLSKATAQAIGVKVAAELGGKYTSDDIASWLESNSQATAKKINKATADEIAAALEAAAEDEDAADTIDAVFDGTVAARANQISATRVVLVAGLAALVAARLSNAKTKTWVTGGNPRSAHASMNGETVPLGELFSNGMNGPGDYSGGADEVANCNCSLNFAV